MMIIQCQMKKNSCFQNPKEVCKILVLLISFVYRIIIDVVVKKGKRIANVAKHRSSRNAGIAIQSG